jgi:hypothetical protein
MSLGKREVKLLIILGLLVYGLLFYLIFINNYLPEIKDVNSKLSAARNEEKALKDDLKNIAEKRAEYNAKSVIDERIDNYLLDSGDVTDCIDYMEKLERLMGNKLTNVRINQPVEKSTSPDNRVSGDNTESENLITGSSDSETGSDVQASTASATGQKYYEMSVSFQSCLSYTEISDLLNFIEGGSRRIKVSNFSMRPSKEKENTNTQNTTGAANTQPTPAAEKAANGEPLYDINMTINIYTVNLGATDKVYEFSKNKFSKFVYNSGATFMVASGGDKNGTGFNYVNYNGNNTNNEGEKKLIPLITSSGADFIINESGYLKAGDNLQIYGVDKSKDVFRYKTNGKTDVQLLLDGSKYTMNINYASGKYRTLSGNLPDRDLNVDVIVKVPNSKESANIRVVLKVINNTSRKVHIKLDDSSRRVSILERSGAEIKGESKKENVSII